MPHAANRGPSARIDWVPGAIAGISMSVRSLFLASRLSIRWLQGAGKLPKEPESYAQASVFPPFTETRCPVMKRAASLARKATILATSSALPIRFIGTFAV